MRLLALVCFRREERRSRRLPEHCKKVGPKTQYVQISTRTLCKIGTGSPTIISIFKSSWAWHVTVILFNGTLNRTIGLALFSQGMSHQESLCYRDQEVISNAIPVQQTRSKKPELYEVLDLGDRVCHTCGQSKESWDFYRSESPSLLAFDWCVIELKKQSGPMCMLLMQDFWPKSHSFPRSFKRLVLFIHASLGILCAKSKSMHQSFCTKYYCNLEGYIKGPEVLVQHTSLENDNHTEF